MALSRNMVLDDHERRFPVRGTVARKWLQRLGVRRPEEPIPTIRKRAYGRGESAARGARKAPASVARPAGGSAPLSRASPALRLRVFSTRFAPVAGARVGERPRARTVSGPELPLAPSTTISITRDYERQANRALPRDLRRRRRAWGGGVAQGLHDFPIERRRTPRQERSAVRYRSIRRISSRSAVMEYRKPGGVDRLGQNRCRVVSAGGVGGGGAGGGGGGRGGGGGGGGGG